MHTFFDHILENKRINVLKEIAHQEYETSRGFAHLTMLLTAENVIQKRLDSLEKELLNSQNDLSKISKEMNEQLQTTLERYIVNTHIQEIPGIGSQLSQRIVTNVFRGHLQDLKYTSSRVSGVGDNKQLMINVWVNRYITQLPMLRQGSFPGKDGIISIANIKSKEIQELIEKNFTQKTNQLEKQRVVKDWVNKLKKVKETDFLAAILTPENANVDLDSFQQGIFAEWEPIPDWFKEIFTVSES